MAMRKPDVPTLLIAAVLIVVAIVFYHATLGRKGKQQ